MQKDLRCSFSGCLATKKALKKSRLFSSGREIRTLDTTGMNRVLWPTELFRHDDGAYRARTCDPLLVRQMLSQLS